MKFEFTFELKLSNFFVQEFTWFPFPVPEDEESTYVVRKTLYYVWIVSNTANWDPTLYKLRQRIDPIPTVALQSASLNVEIVESDTPTQLAVRKALELIISSTSTDNDDWRVVKVSKSDGVLTAKMVFNEKSEDCTVRKYSSIWKQLTGQNRFSLSQISSLTALSDFVNTAAANDMIDISGIFLEQSESCPDNPPIPPPPLPGIKKVENLQENFEFGKVLVIDLSGRNGKIDTVTPKISENFYSIEGDKLSVIIPRANWEKLNTDSIVFSISGDSKSSKVEIKPDPATAFTFSETEFNILLKSEGEMSNYIESSAAFKNLGIPFDIVEMTENNVKLVIPSDLENCSDLYKKYPRLKAGADLGSGFSVATVKCASTSYEKISKNIGKGSIWTIPLPGESFELLEMLPEVDSRLYELSKNYLSILIPVEFSADSLDITLQDPMGNNQKIFLAVSDSAQPTNARLEFTFLDKTSDNWNFEDTRTAISKLDDFGVDFLVLSLDKTTISFAVPTALEKCEKLFNDEVYKDLFDEPDPTNPAEAIFVQAGSGFDNEWLVF